MAPTRGFQCPCNIGNGVSNLVMGSLECLEVLTVRVGNVFCRGDHVAHHRCVIHDFAHAFLNGVALEQLVLVKILAEVRKIIEQVCSGAHAWSKCHDFLALVLGEAQNQVVTHRNLRGQPLGTELAGINAVASHQLCAGRIDWTVDESLRAGAVGDDAGVMEEQREHQLAHGGAADVASADKKNLHAECPFVPTWSVQANDAVCSLK